VLGPIDPETADREPLPILYRDDRLVVVDKPAGLFVHRSALDRSADAALQRVRDQIGRHVWPVHRLDRPTSGALCFALDPEAATLLGTAFSEGRVEKTYLAVVRGHPPETLSIDRPLVPLNPDGHGLKADVEPQEAHTEIGLLAQTEQPWPVGPYPTARYALVEARPKTGRRHQIRRHLAGANHPIIGDGRHGDHRHNKAFAARLDVDRLLLHAARLVLPHPEGESVKVEAPEPGAFQRVGAAFGWTPTTSA
jgi:tRNA pseudouridine65 synthase